MSSHFTRAQVFATALWTWDGPAVQTMGKEGGTLEDIVTDRATNTQRIELIEYKFGGDLTHCCTVTRSATNRTEVIMAQGETTRTKHIPA